MRTKDIEARKLLTQEEKEFYSAVRQEMDYEDDEYLEYYSIGADSGAEIYCEKINLIPSRLSFSYKRLGLCVYQEVDFSIIEKMQDKRDGIKLFLIDLRIVWAEAYFEKDPDSKSTANYISEQYEKDRKEFFSSKFFTDAVQKHCTPVSEDYDDDW